jgi:hypothetical protein
MNRFTLRRKASGDGLFTRLSWSVGAEYNEGMVRVRVLPVAAAALFAVAVAACGDSVEEHGAEGAWPAFFEPEELVEAADAVVVATMLDEAIETVEIDEGDAGVTSVTEILRTFQVEEVLAGVLETGDVFTTFSTASWAHYPGDDEPTRELVYQVLRLEPGDSLVLFLSIVVLPEDYPDEWGTIAWAAPGEPHTARIGAAGELQWETTGRYDDAREARDIDEGAGGAAPEFDITLDELRLLAMGADGEEPEGS